MTHKNTAFMQAISLLVLMIISCSIFYLHVPQVLAVEEVDLEIIQFDSQEGINSLVKYIIKWAFRLAGVFAFMMIVYAGFQYLTSGGNTAQQKDAQERIVSAIIGIILLFAFYIILYTINPDILKEPSIVPTPVPTPAPISPDQEPSGNLVNIKDYSFSPALSTELDGYRNGVFLDENLANDLSDITKNETYAPFVVTDACVTNTLPCLTTENTRPLGDCHYYGTCVDIDSPTGNNKTLITIFNKQGLNVLDEGGWLHIASPEATGSGSYANSGCKTNPCEIIINGVKAYWYKAT